MPGLITRAHVAALLLAAVSLAACAATFAQSGRRVTKPQEVAPVPTPTPEPTPPPKDDNKSDLKKIPLVVLADDEGHYQRAAVEMAEVQDVVVARLRESSALEVAGERRRASRGEAIRRAKGSQDRHVVWLDLQPEMGYETIRGQPGAFVLNYNVYQAGTAKRLAGGTVHLRDARAVLGPLGRVVLPPSCYPPSTSRVEFIYAALEAAERVMKSFSLPVPRRCG